MSTKAFFFRPLAVPKILFSMIVSLLAFFIIAIILEHRFGFTYAQGFIPLFHLDKENNIPSVFSAFQLFLASVILFLITVAQKAAKLRYVHWGILAVGFLYLAFDEAVQLHENLKSFKVFFVFLKHELGLGIPIWIISGSIIVMVIGASFFGFIARLERKSQLHFIAAGALYVTGALVAEGFGRYCYVTVTCSGLSYDLLVFFEEGFEMLSICYFIWALLKYCEANYSSLRIVFPTRSFQPTVGRVNHL